MRAQILEERRVEAQPPEMTVFGEMPREDVGVATEYVEVVFRVPPAAHRGKPVVRQLPADWPYPPEEGY